jgi:hypothetical protein
MFIYRTAQLLEILKLYPWKWEYDSEFMIHYSVERMNKYERMNTEQTLAYVELTHLFSHYKTISS